jgi:hypothetical protein
MKTWIRNNGRALLIIVLMVDLIGITVTRPAWQDNIGYRLPKQTVPYGHSVVLGGVRWQLTSVQPPDQQELEKYAIIPEDLEHYPPHTRLATYVWQRTKDGKPASVPAGYSGCDSIALAGNRQWQKTVTELALQAWAERRGYTSLCVPKYTGPLLLALILPTDVQLTSIDVEFLPDSWGDKTKLSNNSDLLVVRFDTR